MFGMGHLSRNLVLAEVFSANNFQCKFLIKTDDKDKVLSFLKSRNSTSIHSTFLSEEMNSEKDIGIILEHYDIGKSFLVLDHYDHDLQYQKKLRNTGIHWAQFDYKKEDQIFADIVINPNFGVKGSDYDGLIDTQTKLCVGVKFAIISEVFKKTKVKPQPDRILIAMGGGSYPQEVIDMISALVSDKNYRFDLISAQNLFNSKFKRFINVDVHDNPKNIADIYARNHVAIVAGGVTTYELAFLGIPMIVVPYAENQQKNTETWEKFNYAFKYSAPKKFKKNLQAKSLKVILSDLYSHFEKRSKLIDAKGAERIVETIKNQFNG